MIKTFFDSQGNFPQKFVFLDQGSISQTKIFRQSKNFSENKDQEGSLKAKILGPFNTKSYAKIFLTLSACW